jgi:trehalose 6-phosphate phosphatase
VLEFDFDGTLAPIVDQPHEAQVPADVSLGLARLARELPVAIISGRSVADVRPRLGFAPRFVIGNHGGEDPDRTTGVADDGALDALRRRIAAGSEALRDVGVSVEDKELSLALHFRNAPDEAAALRAIDSLLHDCPRSLRRFGGKCVVNVVVAGRPDKGDALLEVVGRSHARAAVFIGDDVNDEAAFARAAPHWLTVRIGRDDPRSAAMFFLDSEAELAVVLERMHALRARG